MKILRSLRYVISPVGEASARAGADPLGTARSGLARGLIIPILLLASLGTMAAALPGHAATSCRAGTAPEAGASGPWMYAKAGAAGPWMYARPGGSGPWMYAKPSAAGPWMYAPPASPHRCA